MMYPALVGFATGFSLILAIGAQNAFVLRHGISKTHVFWICLFAALSDAVLIVAGVFGLSAVINSIPYLPTIMIFGGAAFLVFYAVTRFMAAWRGTYNLELSGGYVSLGKTIGILAGFTWLNPHVYLDTVGLIGTISLQFDMWSHKAAFGLGACVASFVFFFGLGYGAQFLAPIMRSAKAWRILDVLIGSLMIMIAFGLLHSHH